jgi:toxin ParE1/3/4
VAQLRWRVRVSAAADHDFLAVLQWTREHFGSRQVTIYQRTLVLALAALADGGPYLPDSRDRDDVRKGLRTLHMARKGRRGRHFILYRTKEPDVIEVLRILHDSMDVSRHIEGDAPRTTE